MRPTCLRHVVAVALATAAAGVPAAHAAPTDVWLRVEGRSTTLYEGPLRTTGDSIDGGDGTGAHSCQSGGGPASALAASGLSWAGTWNLDFQDFFLDRVAGDASDSASVSYWSILVGWRYAAGICRAQVPAGGEVLLAYGSGARVLRLTGPAQVGVGEPFAVAVRDGWIRQSTGLDGGPVEGASVVGATTGADGRATLRFDTSGAKLLKATAPNAIRSNALVVCVGDARCEGTLAPQQQPTPPKAPAESLSIAVPAAGERYARTASTLLFGGRGVEPVTLRLGGKSGGRCTELATPSRVTSRPCGRAPRALSATTRGTGWTYRLHARLPPGRYTLTVEAAGGAARTGFTVAATPAHVGAARKSADRWLRRAQHRDGGFGAGAGLAPTALFTDWAAIALGSTSEPGTAFRKALTQVRAIRRDALAPLERAALALMPSHARRDRVRLRRVQTAITARQRPDGSWGGDVSATAYAVLSLRGGEDRRELRAGRRWLRAHARALDADTIGAVLWALGPSAPRSAITRLRALQNPDGGFGARAGDPSNAQSTALAVIGLRAIGRSAGSIRSDTGISGVDYLRARQSASGQIMYALDDRRTGVWITAQALLAIGRRTP